jgi:hypothetical protein
VPVVSVTAGIRYGLSISLLTLRVQFLITNAFDGQAFYEFGKLSSTSA